MRKWTDYLLAVLLLLGLNACSNDDEDLVPSSYRVKDITYFFEEGDGESMYEVTTVHDDFYNYTDTEQSYGILDTIPSTVVSFTSDDPAAFHWVAEGDTAWVSDILFEHGQPCAGSRSVIPYIQGTTYLLRKPVSTIVTIPPKTGITTIITYDYRLLKATYLLELEDSQTGETMEVKGKITKSCEVSVRIKREEIELKDTAAKIHPIE